MADITQAGGEDRKVVLGGWSGAFAAEPYERSSVLRFALAVIAVFLAFAIRYNLSDVLGEDAPLLLFLLAVMFSAWVGSTSSGILATAFGGILGVYFFVEPYSSFSQPGLPDIIRISIYALEGVVVSVLIGRLHRAKSNAEDNSERARAARVEAERASNEKSTFLCNMSHEIRTPMAAILGFSDLLSNPDLAATERSGYIDIIRRNTRSLCDLVNDVLDMAKIEAGRVEFEKVEFSILPLLSEVVDLYQLQAARKNVSIKFAIPGEIPENINSDRMRLRQILINIIGNAVKFTKEGSVTIAVTMVPGGSGAHGQLLFSVRDTGVGLSSEQKQRLFEVFQQGDASTTRRFGGSGLGLALSRKLANALGGDVQLRESSPGVGSIFDITIPADNVVLGNGERIARAKEKCEEGCLAGVKVLLVEDSPDNRIDAPHFSGQLKRIRVELLTKLS